ncbi:hypothetical protein A0H81_09378 [Grifola frondosa]|uniref:Uncharacterized protein n=1 Tax=Grifola frondosa TaxID=5627 RepID=A0A1C7LUT4_GRIFR|nr:hypothetical protein A0H81_12659 [Grifola frondosa]OBZ68214.1 hypothetical protein A0H81_11691 [Grifola frondosa]OBZ68523.1 hypothetical protein A0H81_11583 [Grifola frondosa]OBZ70652.1 hypothetical protein A0H81_09378 [Grifola frondosa]
MLATPFGLPCGPLFGSSDQVEPRPPMSRQAFATSRRSYAVSTVRRPTLGYQVSAVPRPVLLVRPFRSSSPHPLTFALLGFTLALRISSEWARSADVCLEAMGAFAPQFENFFFGSV